MGLLGGAIPPSQAVWPQAFALAVPISAVLALLSAATWALSGARWPAASVAVGVVAAPLLVLPPRTPPLDGAPPSLRLLSLNAGPMGPEGAERLAQLLREEAPHVVVLQEAGVSVEPAGDRELVSVHPAVRSARAVGYRRVGDAPAPVGPRLSTLSRLPTRSHTVRALDPSSPRGSVVERTVLTVGGHDVALYNVHLRPFHSDRPWSDQGGGWPRAAVGFAQDVVQRSADARLLKATLASELLPYVVAGDFNATPWQWERAEISDGLSSAVPAWPPRGTFPSRLPVFDIDVVLTGPGWSARGVTGPPGLSDHRPVLADLALREVRSAPPTAGPREE